MLTLPNLVLIHEPTLIKHITFQPATVYHLGVRQNGSVNFIKHFFELSFNTVHNNALAPVMSCSLIGPTTAAFWDTMDDMQRYSTLEILYVRDTLREHDGEIPFWNGKPAYVKCEPGSSKLFLKVQGCIRSYLTVHNYQTKNDLHSHIITLPLANSK